MEGAGYVTLTRQSGLLREMQVVANNVANAGTAGFRREGVIFSEFVRGAGAAPSLSMAPGGARQAFSPGPDGVLRNMDGHALLDAGGSAITIPPGTASVLIGQDGTLSGDGRPISRIGRWLPSDPLLLRHEGGTLFDGGETVPVTGGQILQGVLEDSNVDPVLELARMVEVQRAYEMGQGFLDREDERMRGVIRTMGG